MRLIILKKFVYVSLLLFSIFALSSCEVFKTIYGTNGNSNYSDEIKISTSPNLVEISNQTTTTLHIENVPVQVSKAGNPTVIVLRETDIVRLQPKAEDPDNDKLAFTYTSPLDENGEWRTSYGDAGQYTVTVTASDGKLTDSKDVLLIINKKEEAPAIEKSSPIEAALFMEENRDLTFSVEAADLNKDELTYQWKLDGKDASTDDKFEYKSTYDDAGSHTIKVEVSDSSSSATKIWSVTVKNVNREPSIDDINDINIKENDKVEIEVSAADEDNDPLTYSINDSRFNKVSDNKFEWQTDYDSSGAYKVKVSVSDGTDTVSNVVNVNVENFNRAPTIVEIIQKS